MSIEARGTTEPLDDYSAILGRITRLEDEVAVLHQVYAEIQARLRRSVDDESWESYKQGVGRIAG